MGGATSGAMYTGVPLRERRAGSPGQCLRRGQRRLQPGRCTEAARAGGTPVRSTLGAGTHMILGAVHPC